MVARSSIEAEYRSLAYTIAELLWLKQLIQELHAPIQQQPLLICDNVGAMFLSKNPVISTCSKHISLDFHFICEHVESRALKFCYVSSIDELVDIFTKPLSRDRVLLLRNKLQVCPVLELVGANNHVIKVEVKYLVCLLSHMYIVSQFCVLRITDFSFVYTIYIHINRITTLFVYNFNHFTKN